MRLSDELIRHARLTSEVTGGTIGGQIEFWARLGRAIELLWDEAQVWAWHRITDAVPLSECPCAVDAAEGRQREADYLATRPLPYYESDPAGAGLLIRIEAKGTWTRGRFVDRQFTDVE